MEDGGCRKIILSFTQWKVAKLANQHPMAREPSLLFFGKRQLHNNRMMSKGLI